MKKYLNQPTEFDGIKFDSKREAMRYMVLKDKEKKGEIRDLILQPKFLLCPAFEIGRFLSEKVMYMEVSYIADFSYFDLVSKPVIKVVEDVKGPKAIQTQVYKLKKKLFLKKYVAGNEGKVKFVEIL